MATGEERSALVVIVDTNPGAWAGRSHRVNVSLAQFLEHFLAFLRAYCLLNDHNRVAIFSAEVGNSRLLFPRADQESTISTSDAVHEAINFSLLQSTLLEALEQETDAAEGTRAEYSAFAGAMSLALCYIDRIQKEHKDLAPRLLVIKASRDSPAQYIPSMNCIFAAQKMDVLIDSCVLADEDSTQGQQAALLTGGIYMRPSTQDALLQYLLSLFVVDRQSRKFLNLPQQIDIDYRAACFCHKRAVDIGHVCSVCLSVFCSFSPVCATCGSSFTSSSTKEPIRRAKRKSKATSDV